LEIIPSSFEILYPTLSNEAKFLKSSQLEREKSKLLAAPDGFSCSLLDKVMNGFYTYSYY
jgi:hypothetical protein